MVGSHCTATQDVGCCDYLISHRRISHHLINHRFASIVKPQSFYDLHADSTPIRCYFYNVDLQGRLFLEEVLPKNITSCIKDTKFLDFFFRRLQPLRLRDIDLLHNRDILKSEYPYVSPCGTELNFVRPAATPIVFHSLQGDELSYAGTMVQPFKEKHLAISEETGRLYHRLTGENVLARDKAKSKVVATQKTKGEFGLIRSSVAVALSDRIEVLGGDEDDADGSSGMGIVTESGLLSIPWLPEEAEPGSWAMPCFKDSSEE
jgi:hypothetical protein